MQGDLDSARFQLATLQKEKEDRMQQKMRNGLSGRVLAVNPAWNFVVLSLGDKNGVVNNAELLVKRGTQYIGKVRVTSVEPSTSIADIVANSVPQGTAISPGDDVIYQSVGSNSDALNYSRVLRHLGAGDRWLCARRRAARRAQQAGGTLPWNRPQSWEGQGMPGAQFKERHSTFASSMPGRILVIRGGALGDFILTLPAIRLLRENFRDGPLDILGYRHIAVLAEGYYADSTRSIDYGPLAGFFNPQAPLSTGHCATISQDFSRSLVISMIRMASSRAGCDERARRT